MQEAHSGASGLPQVQYVFLELPKYAAGEHPKTVIEKWAYFFRQARRLTIVPSELSEAPYVEALGVANKSTFTRDEWESYEREGIAIQDARGALTLVHRAAILSKCYAKPLASRLLKRRTAGSPRQTPAPSGSN